MRCSIVSLAAILLATTALAAPVQKREDGVFTEVVTVTQTKIVYVPTGAPPPPTTTPPPPPPPPTSTPPPSTTYAPPPPPPPPPAPKPEPEPEPEPQPAPEPPSGLDEFAQSALQTHNEHRSKHGSPPLEWSAEMASFATSHTSSCVFEHSSNSGFGENLAAGHSSIKEAIDDWYAEEALYDYGAGQFSGDTGHFTQMVWKSATKVGCGFTVCDGQNGTPGTYYSCNYDEGNLIGSFTENVTPPL